MSTRSERIKYLIEKSGKSYQELERITGIKKSSLQRYASGATVKIPLDVIERLCIVFGVQQDYLTGWESAIYECPDDENPHELKMRDAFDTLDIDGQIEAAQMVVDFAKNGKSPSQLELTEGEKAMLELFRLVPEDKQQLVLGMIRAALCTDK